jgi:hypothetical protein
MGDGEHTNARMHMDVHTSTPMRWRGRWQMCVEAANWRSGSTADITSTTSCRQARAPVSCERSGRRARARRAGRLSGDRYGEVHGTTCTAARRRSTARLRRRYGSRRGGGVASAWRAGDACAARSIIARPRTVYTKAPNFAGCRPSFFPNSPGQTHAKCVAPISRRNAYVTGRSRRCDNSISSASALRCAGPRKLSSPPEPSFVMALIRSSEPEWSRYTNLRPNA